MNWETTHGRPDRRTNHAARRARTWTQEKSPVTAFRKMRDSGTADGYDPAAFAEMAEMGWAGVIIPEEFGGSDFGYLSLGLVLEETGRTLTASPLLSTALAATSALMLGGTDAQKKDWLPKSPSGEVVAHAGASTKARTTRRQRSRWRPQARRQRLQALRQEDLRARKAARPMLFVVAARTSRQAGRQGRHHAVPRSRRCHGPHPPGVEDRRQPRRGELDIRQCRRRRRRGAGHGRPGLRRCWKRCSTAPAPASPPKCSARRCRPSRRRSTI